MSSREDVLEFWFGEARSGLIGPEVRAQWFKKDSAFDREIGRRFGELHASATRGELDAWCATPTGALALIIVLDQFSRNLFRGDARTWAHDPAALACARAIIEAGEDAQLAPFERVFLYMPLMHAEDRAAQELCVEKFDALAAEQNGELAKLLSGNVGYARKHAVIVERFGRFPHRNAILGRESTDEEIAFLEGPNSSF